MQTYQFDKLIVKKADSRAEMGKTAASDCAEVLRKLLGEKETVSMIFAAAPSQNETLDALIAEPGIDWTRVTAFHMDEYVGLANDHPQSFGTYLREHIFSRLPFGKIHYIRGDAEDSREECARYSALLTENPPDIVCMGIGENGHIAFNDPHVADFQDPAAVKVVDLDDVCRMQQVHDGCFASLDLVPKYAMTLTVPTLAGAAYQFCVVPASTKAWAVRETICSKIGKHCPATILRRLDNAIMYVDEDSAALITEVSK